MFCPECGEVIASGPLDLRACHAAKFVDDRSGKVGMRLRRAVGRLLRQPAATCGRPNEPLVDEPWHLDKNNPNRAE